jgi:hypothetical protein
MFHMRNGLINFLLRKAIVRVLFSSRNNFVYNMLFSSIIEKLAEYPCVATGE